MPQKILVAEDDQEAGSLLVRSLVAHGYAADHFVDGAQAMEQLCQMPYDLLILDWEMPGLSGLDLCKQYRASGGQSPVLMLTGRREIDDKESGFGAGADDYLTKPFSTRELVMRVEALLRRPALVRTDQIKVGKLLMEPASHRLHLGNEEIRLSRLEFAVLEFFMRHPNEIFSAETLLSRVWPVDSDAGVNTVLNYITKLRQKLDAKGEPSIIETIHGVGYRLRS